MELAEIIKNRRSVSLFEDRPVPVDLVRELLDVAVWAPNHGVTQPWRFILVCGESRRLIARANRVLAERWGDTATQAQRGQQAYDNMMAVPAFVVVVILEDQRPLKREEDYAATCCVIQNFSLLAWEKGLGSVWKTYGLLFEESFREALKIQPGEKVVGVLHVGYPAKVPQGSERVPGSERLTVLD